MADASPESLIRLTALPEGTRIRQKVVTTKQ
jgi:hypothetical protein